MCELLAGGRAGASGRGRAREQSVRAVRPRTTTEDEAMSNHKPPTDAPDIEPEASVVLTLFPGGQVHIEAIDATGERLSPIALLEILNGVSQVFIREIKGAVPPPKKSSGLVVAGSIPRLGGH